MSPFLLGARPRATFDLNVVSVRLVGLSAPPFLFSFASPDPFHPHSPFLPASLSSLSPLVLFCVDPKKDGCVRKAPSFFFCPESEHATYLAPFAAVAAAVAAAPIAVSGDLKNPKGSSTTQVGRFKARRLIADLTCCIYIAKSFPSSLKPSYRAAETLLLSSVGATKLARTPQDIASFGIGEAGLGGRLGETTECFQYARNLCTQQLGRDFDPCALKTCRARTFVANLPANESEKKGVSGRQTLQ